MVLFSEVQEILPDLDLAHSPIRDRNQPGSLAKRGLCAPVEFYREHFYSSKKISVVNPTLFYINSEPVILTKAGIHIEKTGFPRIKYGAGLVKPGMTIKRNKFMNHYISRTNKSSRFEALLFSQHIQASTLLVLIPQTSLTSASPGFHGASIRLCPLITIQALRACLHEKIAHPVLSE